MGRKLLVINGAVITGCAFFDFSYHNTLFIALLFFLPLLDKQWALNCFNVFNGRVYLWGGVICCFIALLLLNEGYELIALNIILFTALPEEWFFRGYFLQRLELFSNKMWLTNGISSIFFAILHVPAQGWSGLLVFVPSLLFGWLYQLYRDLVLVILLHALFNVIYLLYLKDILL